MDADIQGSTQTEAVDQTPVAPALVAAPETVIEPAIPSDPGSPTAAPAGYYTPAAAEPSQVTETPVDTAPAPEVVAGDAPQAVTGDAGATV